MMNLNEFAKRMMELMPQIMKGIARHENNYLTRGKITFPQYWVLLHLSRHGQTTMSAIATMLGVSKPSATGTVERLIAQGFVRRDHDDKDRRIVWIAATVTGKKIINDILRQKQQITVKIFAAIPEEDRNRHLLLLEKIVEVLDTKMALSESSKMKGLKGA
jgi:DNA-binding MarR family transcriptional regulator